MDKEIGGQPLWIWLVGAAVVIGGYLYIIHKSSSSSGQQPAPGGTNKSTSTFSETIKDLQSPPTPLPKPKPKPKPKAAG